MNIIERKLNDVTVLDLEGGLALEDNAQFRKLVTAIIDAGARKLIVNGEGRSTMDGSGLGDPISCYTTLQRMSGRIKLLHLSDRLQYLLVITKLTYVFETLRFRAGGGCWLRPRSERRRRPDENTSEFSSLARSL